MSRIEWTEVTWNPVTGCDKVSPGCDHCYALRLAGRLKAMGQAKYQHDGDPRTSGPGFGVTCHPASLTLPCQWRQPRLVFVNSMSDLFHPKVPDAFIARVFAVMARTPHHTYQVLTKRAARMRALLSHRRFLAHVGAGLALGPEWADAAAGYIGQRWPLPNVWLGVSAEDQDRADRRIPALLDTPAAVRFVSAEPLLGPIDLGQAVTALCPAGYYAADPLHSHWPYPPGRLHCDHRPGFYGIGWVIAGGESGPGCRPVDLAWVRGLRDQCQHAGVPFFYKQHGGPTPKAGGRVLDGRTWDQMPATGPPGPPGPLKPPDQTKRGPGAQPPSTHTGTAHQPTHNPQQGTVEGGTSQHDPSPS